MKVSNLITRKVWGRNEKRKSVGGRGKGINRGEQEEEPSRGSSSCPPGPGLWREEEGGVKNSGQLDRDDRRTTG